MRKKFDDQLAKLTNLMKESGTYCEEALDKAIRVFFDKDLELAEQVYSASRSVDKKTRKIENLCFMLLLRQQPVAIDLRKITASLKANFDIKRISSQAFDIAEISKFSLIPGNYNISPKETEILRKMSDQTKMILSQSLSTFFAMDAKSAEALIEEDDVVDECFAQIKSHIADDLSTKKAGDYAVDVLMIAKYFERMSDHCINLARWTIKYFG